MAKWNFYCTLIDGRCRNYVITASSVHEAVRKGMEKTKKSSNNEQIVNWNCKLRSCD